MPLDTRPCPKCNGTGTEKVKIKGVLHFRKCTLCNGSGFMGVNR